MRLTRRIAAVVLGGAMLLAPRSSASASATLATTPVVGPTVASTGDRRTVHRRTGSPTTISPTPPSTMCRCCPGFNDLLANHPEVRVESR